MRKPWLRPIAVLVLIAALAAGTPAQAAPAQASPDPTVLAGDLFAPLRALLDQAAGALRSLWSAAEGETGQESLEDGSADVPLAGTPDLLENGAGIDPNG